MAVSQWDVTQQLFEDALRRPPGERASYLEAACPEDPGLCRKVMRMVDLHERDPDFLETPAVLQILKAPLLTDGQFVAGRFRIARLVGMGGMGEVYEAHDLLNPEHPERVALKIVRPGMGTVDETAAGLHRDVQLAHRITHPNVRKTHFLYEDRRPEGDRLLLIMDFLDGETLAERLDLVSALDPAVALAIAGQIAAGIDAAHAEGVIHKDLKSSNVMLVPRRDGTTRPVITDFGIAASEEEVFMPGMGTYAYMAPERLADASVTKAADIYSFGVVLHEMVTGELPFAADAPLGQRQRLPAAPSTRRRGLSRRWDRVILKCLHPSADGRFESATAAVSALRPMRWWIPAAAALLALLVAWTIGERTRPFSGAPAIAAGQALAMLPFELHGKAKQHEGLLNHVGAQLQSNPLIRKKWLVFSPTDARQMKVTTVERAMSVFGVGFVLVGSLAGDDASVTVTAQLFEAGGARPVRTFVRTCPLDNTACLQDGLVEETAALLDAETGFSSQLPPMAKEAFPYYLQGIEYLRRDAISYALAIPFFEDAIARDASAALPRVALADAHMLHFRDKGDKTSLGSARTVLEAVLASNPDLPEAHASFGTLHRMEGRYDAAARELQIAVAADPSNHLFRRMLGDVYDVAQRDDDAAAAFEKVIELQPRYWGGYHNYAVFHYRRGRYDAAAALLERLITWTPDHAQALATLGGVYVALGRDADAERVSRRSCALLPTRSCFVNLGFALKRQGRTEDALAAYHLALELNPTETLFLNIADAYAHLGRRAEAVSYFRRAATRAEEGLRLNLQNSGQRAILAYSLAQIGDRTRAAFEMEQALQHSPTDGTVQRYGVLTFETIGQRDRALEVLRRSPRSVLEELERSWGTAQLRADPRYEGVAREVRKH